ncbi:hypothetical protein ES706_00353 [subsurface metagenome]|nr:gfo/Idh/MocA family oxidoreductase [Hadesarchaea archaeon]
MERLGVGFVGAGFITNTYHLNAWRGVRHADITAVCARHEATASVTAGLCRKSRIGEPKVYTDVREMVRDPEVDAIWINVPTFARIPVMQAITEEVTQGRAELVGVACEKPLARNVKESRKMLELVKKAGLLHGYLENHVFAPAIVKGKDILWRRGASSTGRPYLARCGEEHGGPHKAWYWDGAKQGGGALFDMLSHCLESARFLLTAPKEPRSLKPRTVSAEIASLKWTKPYYVKRLKETTKGEIDFSKAPVEDFARANISYETPDGALVMTESWTSWSFTGPGLRMDIELLGPEYYMQINTLNPELYVFFSREVKGKPGEEMLEKQAADQGLMPVVSDESNTYGFRDENRHMVESFLDGKMPRETWEDGAFVVELLMACYMAAERGKKLKFPPKGLEKFVPQVAKKTWKPRSVAEAPPE